MGKATAERLAGCSAGVLPLAGISVPKQLSGDASITLTLSVTAGCCQLDSGLPQHTHHTTATAVLVPSALPEG